MAFARKGSEPPAIKNKVAKKATTKLSIIVDAPPVAPVNKFPSFFTFSLASMLYSPKDHPYQPSSRPFLPNLNLSDDSPTSAAIASQNKLSVPSVPTLPSIKASKSR